MQPLPQFSTPPFLSSTTTSTASCLTCSQYLASQSRGVQQLLLRGLFGKKWPTQDTTEGGMAKQPRELDPAHHATRAGIRETDGNCNMVLSATACEYMILRNFYQKGNKCTAETTPWLLCRLYPLLGMANKLGQTIWLSDQNRTYNTLYPCKISCSTLWEKRRYLSLQMTGC